MAVRTHFSELFSGMFGNGIASGKGLFFLQGVWRSGTTWIGRMLASHPSIYVCQHELQTYQKGLEVRQFGEALEAHPFLQERFVASRKAGFLSMLQHLHTTQKSGAVLIGDRSPGGDVWRIKEDFPDAKIIVALRDGRDVCVSVAHHASTSARTPGLQFLRDEDQEQPRFSQWYLESLAARYADYIEDYFDVKARYPDDVLLIRYEDLNRESASVMQSCFTFLGLDVAHQTVADICAKHTFVAESGRKPGDEDVTAFMRKGIVGDWKRYFSDASLASYEAIAGNALQMAGYELYGAASELTDVHSAESLPTDSRRRITFDLFAPEVRQDPYPYYRQLREHAPVHYFESEDCWTVTRYEDVAAVMRNFDEYSSACDTVLGPTLVRSDRPLHTRIRRIVGGAFTSERIASLETSAADITDRLIDGVVANGKMELMGDLARPLPALVTAELLGVDPDRSAAFGRWTHAALLAERRQGSAESPELETSLNEMDAFFQSHVEMCRRNPQRGIISEFLRGSTEQESLTVPEAMSFAKLMVIAGSETTSNLIGNAVMALLEHPDQLQIVRANPNLVPNMVEEAMRYDTPAQMLDRWTVEEVEIAGIRIPAGAHVRPVAGSANRDPRRFVEPDRFLVQRDPKGHIAFGTGPHYCLGAMLARLEARIVFAALVTRLPNLHAAQTWDSIEFLDFVQLRGPKRLELTFTSP